MMKRLLTYTLTVLMLLTACTANQALTEQQALDFLYRYMPLPDRVDYDTLFYQRNVHTAFQARAEMPWGMTVPEREFLHFVLPVRVNNENLDESRMLFYEHLKERVQHLSMQEAILEVNHWCHERVTYMPSDERTSSPLASIRSAYGRCGEESTFTVAALRAVGIPARQVYTPRWAHTDDNHAWVEAWADGEWHFMGACEPEAVLDLGWFNAPASRGLLMHTKVFGAYDGPEEVISRTECYTEINVTRNYAPVGMAYVQVVDTNGLPVQGAEVSFRIYNYAEFYPVATKQTDVQGVTALQTGMGDMLAWAAKDGVYGLAKCSAAKADTTVLVLDKQPGRSYALDLEMVPPAERNTVPALTPEQQDRNARRLAYEDSLRGAYMATFDRSTPLLEKTRGNHPEIKKFLQETGGTQRAQALLQVISNKDLRDVSSATLLDSYQHTPENTQLPADFYNRYVLNPRVANEMILPNRAFFQQQITAEQKQAWTQDVQQLVQWMKEHIQLDAEHNPQDLRMTPMGVWQHRTADAFSRNICFVTVCRSLGMPARIDPVTAKVQVADNQQQWVDVAFEQQVATQQEQGVLRATYQPTAVLDNPKYYSHFSLSAIRQGIPVLQSYAEDDTYASLLRNGTAMDAGDYMLVSGTRMASGSVLVHVEICAVQPDTVTTVPLVMRTDSEALQVIGAFNSESLYQEESGAVKSILSTTGRGYFIVGLIAPNNEPTTHVLRDMALYKKELEQWGRKIVLVFRNQSEADRFHREDFPNLPSNVVFGVDVDGGIAAQMQGTAPVIQIADTFNRVVFESQGYTIGIGETLVKAIAKL